MGKPKHKNKTKNPLFWRIFPFILFIFIIGFLLLISGGYDYFEEWGWNPDIVIVIRYIATIIWATITFILAVLLLKYFIGICKGWRSGERYSSLHVVIEVAMVTLFMLGPSIALFLFSFVQVGIMFFPDDPYWRGYWELK
ncbi:hypothetical protein [Ureibacillus acetophenoni]|uniref:Uncharacterized protein n=1 Tax=Ureibacillus acetophenoni TaxID=614649 RepID=A0A285UI01_9BACL|nr:hypothetical protein [Ureibacillus acetophenoni]SOC41489.1 hypothetical protein SAMN05877842_110100 [Ureibacillus acetophenoni]